MAAAGRALREAGSRPIAILAVSVGAGPALAAAADPALAVSAVMTLGGYASARELLRFTLTGDDRGGVLGGRRPDEAAIAAFVAANPDLVDEAGRRLVDNRDPAAMDALLARLSATSQRILDALSPERWVARIRAPLFLVHGHDDPAVPVSESVRLATAAARAGGDARLMVVGAVGHVEPGAGARLADLARLAAAFYAFLVISAGAAHGDGPGRSAWEASTSVIQGADTLPRALPASSSRRIPQPARRASRVFRCTPRLRAARLWFQFSRSSARRMYTCSKRSRASLREQRRTAPRAARGLVVDGEVEREVVQADHRAGGQGHAALDHVLQLAHVARPVVAPRATAARPARSRGRPS